MSYTRLAAEVIYLACSDYLLLARHGMVRGFRPTRHASQVMSEDQVRKRNATRKGAWSPHPVDRRLKRLGVKRIQDLQILCDFFGEPVGVLLRISGLPLHPAPLRKRVLEMETRGDLFTGHYYVSKN